MLLNNIEKGGKQASWTDAIAVGGKEYISQTKALLEERTSGRDEYYEQGQYILKEAHTPYSPVFDAKKGLLSEQNIPCADK